MEHLVLGISCVNGDDITIHSVEGRENLYRWLLQLDHEGSVVYAYVLNEDKTVAKEYAYQEAYKFLAGEID